MVPFYLQILFFGCLHILNIQAGEEIPRLVMLAPNGSNAWTHLSPLKNTNVYLSKWGGQLKGDCRASYPVQYRILGFIDPIDLIDTYQYRTLEESESNLVIHFNYDRTQSFDKNYTNVATSLALICEKVGDPSRRSIASIFVSGNHPILGTTSKTVINSKTIPCYTTDPFQKAYLFKLLPDKSLLFASNVIYVPYDGFRSYEVFNGTFLCVKGSNVVEVIATTTEFVEDVYAFSPKDSILKAFHDEPIKIICAGEEESVELIFFENITQPVSVEYLRNETGFLEVILSINSTEELDTISGSFHCTFKTDDVEHLQNWTFNFYRPPTLRPRRSPVDTDLSIERNLVCSSMSKDIKVIALDIVKCESSSQCRMRVRCLDPHIGCKFMDENHKYYSTTSRPHAIIGYDGSKVESSAFASGLARCNFSNGLSRTWEYFFGLDDNLYINWRDAPTEALVRFVQFPSIFQSNFSSEFECAAIAYLFTYPLLIELEYENGSRISLNDDSSMANYSAPTPSQKVIATKQLYRATVAIQLPIESVAIHCIAYSWNTTDRIDSAINFKANYLQIPIVLDANSGQVTVIKGFVNSTNFRLTCLAKGEPHPIYYWLFKNGTEFTKVKDMHSQVVINSGENGEGFLEFPLLEQKYAGEYKCIARNLAGEASNTYQLEIDYPAQDIPIDYTFFIVPITVFIIILLTIITFFLGRMYLKNRNRLRNLSDKELHRFYRGEPEKMELNLDDINHLPFNSELEIDMEDVAFNFNAILGSGQFSYVAKGQLKRADDTMDVAVKISKSTASIELFKCLLAEVKIMQYLGDQENIVKLIGVCTDSIQNKSVYILTNLCENGSLEKFLRKYKDTFLDMTNNCEENDKTSLASDLIRFSYEIANGMEYLSTKGVVHADLAARNVLVTFEKTLKISDFGMSRKLISDKELLLKLKLLPFAWRWMAPESLSRSCFSIQSDVWSYGITLYEIFTLGDQPFPNESWNSEFERRLNEGMRLSRPKYSTPEIYSKLLCCWEAKPRDRPGFRTLREEFEAMFAQARREKYD